GSLVCLSDARTRDGGALEDSAVVADPCSPLIAGRNPGSMCRAGTTCSANIECQPEGSLNLPTKLPDGGSGPSVRGRLFTGSMCGNACDPTDPVAAPTDTTHPCGQCGYCSGSVRIGNLDVPLPSSLFDGVCRAGCLPSPTDNGGCRDGYTCDPGLGLIV